MFGSGYQEAGPGRLFLGPWFVKVAGVRDGVPCPSLPALCRAPRQTGGRNQGHAVVMATQGIPPSEERPWILFFPKL